MLKISEVIKKCLAPMFITTLPILFVFTNLLTPFEFSMLFIAIFITIYLMTPISHQAYHRLPSGSLYDYLLGAWLGEIPLRWTFWPFFLLVNVVFYYIDYRIAAETYTINSWKTVHLMLALPIFWWVLSVWRCSLNTRSKIWSATAKTLTLYLVFDFLLRIILSTYYPQTLFNCRLLLIEYGDC